MKNWIVAGFVLLAGFSLQAETLYSSSSIEYELTLNRAREQEVDSVIVVFKEEATIRSKKGGKSALEKAAFKSIKGLEKSIKHSLKKTKKNKKGAAEHSRAARNLENMYVAQVADGMTLSEALQELKKSPLVKYAEKNQIVHTLALPSDPYFNEVWASDNHGQSYHDRDQNITSGTSGADMNWTSVWDTAEFPTNEVIVAVLDTGVDYTHYDLTNQMWVNTAELNGTPDYDDDGNGYIDDIYGIDTGNGDSDPMDDNAHGTHCAGTIAAEANNGQGIAGVNPYAKIMAIKFIKASGSGATLDAIDGLLYAANMGAQVINNSWGGGGYLQAVQDAINYCNEQGVLVMAAAGNNGSYRTMFPASYAGVVSVAASQSDDTKVYFSNYAPSVDVMAPGHDILSLRATGTLVVDEALGSLVHPDEPTLAVFSGTSMACPNAVGVASLLIGATPGGNPFLYSRVLEEGCDTNVLGLAGNLPYEGFLGSGRVDVKATLDYDEPTAFLSSHLAIWESFSGAKLSRGDSTEVIVRLGTWKQPMTNLVVQITDIPPEIALNSTNYAVGDLGTFAYVTMPTNQFVLTVQQSAEYGVDYTLKVLLKQGDTIVEEKTITVPVQLNDIKKFLAYDLNNDGYKEVIGENFNTLYTFNDQGKLQWIEEVGIPGEPGSQVTCLSAGDFNGDGNGQILTISDKDITFIGSSEIRLLDNTGTITTNLTLSGDVWFNEFCVADLQGNGRDNLIVKLGSTSIAAYDVSNGLQYLWAKNKRTGDYEVTTPAVGDLDGDGQLETVFFDHPSFSDNPVPYNSTLYIIRADGSVKLAHELETDFTYTACPRLADMNGDGIKEILCFAFDTPGHKINEGRDIITILDSETGRPWDGWPRVLNINQNTFCLGDLDMDGQLEIIGTGTGLADTSYTLRAFHNTGEPVAGFPITESIDHYSDNIVVSDVDADGFPDILYPSAIYTNEVENITLIDVLARDRHGLQLHGWPKTFTQESADGFTLDEIYLAVEELAPGYSEDKHGQAVVMLTAQKGLHIYETGSPFDPAAHFWGAGAHDGQRTSCYEKDSIAFKVAFAAAPRAAAGAFDAIFTAKSSGTNTTGVTYQWDFDNDSSVDLTTTSPVVTNTYSVQGDHSVSLTASNAVGEVSTVTKTDYLHVYPAAGTIADFTWSPNSAQAPIGIQFTDTSLHLAEDTHVSTWDFDGDGYNESDYSGQLNPIFVFTNAGTYNVRHYIQGSYEEPGEGDWVNHTITVSGDFGPVTNHYVSPNGAHNPPFKTWAEAATNLSAALAVAASGDHVIVSNGVYSEGVGNYGMLRLLGTNITLRSVNGPEVTIIDGLKRTRLMHIQGPDHTLSGFTLRNGKTEGTSAGILIHQALGTMITNCWFINNEATYRYFNPDPGGAISFTADVLGDGYNTLISDSLFVSNRSYEAGGAIAGVAGVIVDRCEFTGNWGRQSGGTISGGVEVRNSIFYGNSGGASVVSAYGGRIENCVFTGNESAGGAAHSVHTHNTISVDNIGPNYSSNMTDTDAEVAHNCTTPDTGQPGCITVDPQFANASAHDYRVQSASPCIDGGTNWFTYTNSIVQTINFDFGWTELSGADYNNVTSMTAGAKITNAHNTESTATGVSLAFTDAFTLYEGGAPNHAAPFSSQAMDDGFGAPHGTINHIVLGGLNPAKTYEISVMGSSSSNLGTTRWKAEEGSSFGVSMSPYNTSQNMKTFQPLSPDASGDVHISCTHEQLGSSQESRFSALRIEEIGLVPVDQPISNWLDKAKTDRIQNDTVDVGAYEYNGSNLAPRAIGTLADTDRRANRSLSFDGSASYDPDGTITTYHWAFGDGSTASSASAAAAHTYTSEGQRLVTLTVTDNDGATDAHTFALTILADAPDAPIDLHGTNDAPLQVSLDWTDQSDDKTGFRVERKVYAYPPIDLIVDDTEMTFVGWPDYPDDKPTRGLFYTNTPSVATNAWGGSYRYSTWPDGTLSSYAEQFAPPCAAFCYPPVDETGWYEVLVRWPDSSNWPNPYFAPEDEWSSGMHLTVEHTGGATLLMQDTTGNDGQWNSIGTFQLNASSHIKFNAKLSYGRIAVDAVRFIKVEEFSVAGQTAAGITNFTDTAANGVTDGKTYHYRVAATNAEGISEYSNEIAVPIDFANQRPTAAITSINHTNGVAPLPMVVTGLGTDADGSITNYIWDFGDGYSGSRMSGATLTNVTYSYRNLGTYTISLVVQDDGGRSSTNVAEMSVTLDGAIPNAPSALRATANGGAIDLDWQDESFIEDGYELQRDSSALATVGANTTEYSDTTAAPGFIYAYRVRATNAFGASEWAGPVSAALDAAAYTLPFEETFETTPTNMAGTLGDLNEQHGWNGGGTVQNGTVHSEAQALSLAQATASHSFLGEASNVWITLWAEPVFSEVAPENIPADSAAVFYVNTNGQLVAYNSTNATVLTGTTVSNGWNKFEIECDYSSKVWNLSINDVPVVGNFVFYGSPASFQALELTEASRDGTSFFDSITVSNTSDDSDGDGLPDSWENQYWPGDLSHSPGDPAANPDYTVMECYIAGLDPTDENAAFLISDFLPLTSVISWNNTSGRVYSIYWTSNLLSGFGNSFANGITGGAFTDSTHSADAEGFYKIEVQIDE